MRGSLDPTPELLGHVKHRYQETNETVRSIATDAGVAERTVYRWAKEGGWRRRRARPRELPPDLQLTLDVDHALEEADVGAGLKPAPTDSTVPSDAGASDRHNDREGGLRPAPTADEAAAGPVDLLAVAERLERQLEQNLARVERMREAQWPHNPADAERTTRALERLTDALLKVRRLRNPETNTADRDGADRNDFDMPGDIDEFRRAFARRIRAFVRSRTGGDVPEPGETRGAGCAGE
jgi:hypothetical protein